MSRPVLRLQTTSAQETKALAAALSELARPCDLLLLVGDLGAGKTAFTQGFGAGLGVEDQVTSPTFSLVRQYEGRLDLNHLDVYRLGQVSEALDLGLSELLDEGAVTVIEWGDTILPALPPDHLVERITSLDGETERPDVRTLEQVARGPQWAARQKALATALETWAVDAGRDSDDPDEETL